MKSLAQYLTEYLEQEMELQLDGDLSQLARWIKHGIDAYQSTEDCKIKEERVAKERNRHHYHFSSLMLIELLDAAREIVRDFKSYGEVLQHGDNGEYGTESGIGRLSAIVAEIDNK